ncbi:MAG: hypothetical protein V4702_02115 [Patescibacteria group bacterium]
MEDSETILPCADKLSFDTKTEAERSAIVAEWQHGSKLKVYKCRHCQLWHLATN